ncbi:MAG TPA: DUF1538 domain-containing protein [Bacillota bacterium]|jgi:hypothetical protein|nr:DUF1538 domain-containing protein [Peptococcaceae bacterium MAG4]NLW37250.1 DUF1538 domain-containing protein [Peptococcaceae bacterium]HUM59406.1 DUF1538 domain-containing protein [Bacillota bacterium]
MDDLKDVAKEVLSSTLPIVVMVVLCQFIFFENPGNMVIQFIIGAIMVTLGLGLFLIGVKIGLLPLGEAIGAELPQRGSVIILLLAMLFIGIAVTVAEPQVNILANQFEYVSGGSIPKYLLISFVAAGIGLFFTIATARVLLNIPMKHILTAGYLLVFILAAFVPPSFLPISFDAGGVTTGPLTVPFIIALGVGLTSVLGGKSSMSDSFGFLALVLIGPILAVMLLGVIYG